MFPRFGLQRKTNNKWNYGGWVGKKVMSSSPDRDSQHPPPVANLRLLGYNLLNDAGLYFAFVWKESCFSLVTSLPFDPLLKRN